MELVEIRLGTSLFYYIYLLACFGVFFGLYFGLRNKSEKIQKRVLFGILAFNFVLHFAKLAFPEYISKGFPQIIRKCTPENICAISTMIFPFIYISKWKTGKDYMFYLGMISGVASCFAPMPIFGLKFYQLETIRCYICHASIWQVPLLMVIFGHHKLDYRRIWKSLVMYFIILCVIIVNELILIRIGWVDTSTLEDFFDSSQRDMGYAVGLPASMGKYGNIVLWLTPKAWRNVPILWELFPVIILGGFGCICLCLYWEHEHIRQDMLLIIGKIKGFVEKRKAKKAGTDTPGDESIEYNVENKEESDD